MLKEYFQKKLVSYRVEYIIKNKYNKYLKEWFHVDIRAVDGEQAIEFLKQEFDKIGENSENYIYTIRGIETVYLFWEHENVKVYTKQKPIFDDEMGYYLFKTEDGRWIAQDDAIGEWIQIRG